MPARPGIHEDCESENHQGDADQQRERDEEADDSQKNRIGNWPLGQHPCCRLPGFHPNRKCSSDQDHDDEDQDHDFRKSEQQHEYRAQGDLNRCGDPRPDASRWQETRWGNGCTARRTTGQRGVSDVLGTLGTFPQDRHARDYNTNRRREQLTNGSRCSAFPNDARILLADRLVSPSHAGRIVRDPEVALVVKDNNAAVSVHALL